MEGNLHYQNSINLTVVLYYHTAVLTVQAFTVGFSADCILPIFDTVQCCHLTLTIPSQTCAPNFKVKGIPGTLKVEVFVGLLIIFVLFLSKIELSKKIVTSGCQFFLTSECLATGVYLYC